jgi:hypothetical protein
MKATTWMMAGALLVLGVCALVPTARAICADPNPLTTGSSVNILLLVWVDAPYGLFTGDITSTTATAIPGYGISFSQPYLLGLSMYVDAMRAQGTLPLPNGQSTRMNFVYFNLANKVSVEGCQPCVLLIELAPL